MKYEKSLNQREYFFMKTIKKKKVKPCVHGINAVRLNERLTFQQGTFLCSTSLRATFMENLEASFRKQNCEDKVIRMQIKCDSIERRKILMKLHRMNINETVLFPGIDGFARSLQTFMPLEEHLKAGSVIR